MGLEACWHPKQHGAGEILLIVCPEHADTIAREKWAKAQVRARIQEITSRPLRELIPDAESGEGIPLKALGFTNPTPEQLEHAHSEISQSGKYQYDCGRRRGGEILRRVRRMGQRTDGLEQRQPAHRGGIATTCVSWIRPMSACRFGARSQNAAARSPDQSRCWISPSHAATCLIEQVAARLREEMPGVEIRRYKKPTFTKPAPEELRRQIAKESDFVIEALAD